MCQGVRIGEGRKEGFQGHENSLEVMDVLIILTVVVVSLMYTYIKIHQIAHL